MCVSLTVVDGWLPARFCYTFTPRVFAWFECILYYLFLHSSTLTPSFSAFTVLVFVPVLFCFLFLPVPFLSYHIAYFPLVAFFPSSAVDCLPEQHVAGGESKKARVRRGKKAHWQKLLPLSLLVAAKKYINYLHDWMMLAQLWACCLCWDEWRSSAQRRFLCRLFVFVFFMRIQPHHQ